MADVHLVTRECGCRMLTAETHRCELLADMGRKIIHPMPIADDLGHAGQGPCLGGMPAATAPALRIPASSSTCFMLSALLRPIRLLLTSTLSPPASHSTRQRPGGLAVDAQTARDSCWRDSFLKQARGFQPMLLEGRLINGSGPGHAGNSTLNQSGHSDSQASIAIGRSGRKSW